MNGPVAARLSGNRLHLQHGPIDLVIGADGDQEAAYRAAYGYLETVLGDLVRELDALRQPPAEIAPEGRVARAMHRATVPFSDVFVTPMAAVAGAVADNVLGAMIKAESLDRAYVNNGGDIAFHLGRNASFKTAIAAHDGSILGQIELDHAGPVRGIATSGRHGRSLSLGIADSVTVLARNAAEADVAATLIANAVDLPDHPAVTRKPACHQKDDTDLGERPVVTDVATLSVSDTNMALCSGLDRAQDYLAKGLIYGAALHLNGETRTLNVPMGALEHA